MRTLKQKGKDIVWVVAGNAVLALAVSMFILPYDILSGGVAGIAVALQPLIPLPVTLMVNLLVVGLFILGACFLGKEFAMKTILSSLIYPVFLTFFSGRVPVLDLDPILASLYGGLLGGMGVGMALRTGASTGGMDIPPLIVHQLTHIEIAKLVLITDALTVLLAGAPMSVPAPASISMILLPAAREGTASKSNVTVTPVMSASPATVRTVSPPAVAAGSEKSRVWKPFRLPPTLCPAPISTSLLPAPIGRTPSLLPP